MSKTEIKLLTVKDISEIYKIPKNTVYELLHTKGCPIVKGGNGKRFLVEKGEFEKWLKSLRITSHLR